MSRPRGATILGWHAEGPFLEPAKRGAHSPVFLRSASQGFKSFEDVYGQENLLETKNWLSTQNNNNNAEADSTRAAGVRIITAAPEIRGVMDAIPELTSRGVVFALGHRQVFISFQEPFPLDSIFFFQ